MIVGNKDIQCPLELMECIIAFDSRDWFTDKRDRMIYAIVFGMDGCEDDYRRVGYSEDMINEYKQMHKRWEQLKEQKNEQTIYGI